MPLSTTIWSPAAILHEVLFTAIGGSPWGVG
jgi:hypothetical protein